MSREDSQVVVLTKVPIPWYAPRFLILKKMNQTLEQYSTLPGLEYKYYTITEDRKFGGVYLWQNLAVAQSWFSKAWFDEVLKRYKAPAEVHYFETFFILNNELPMVHPTQHKGQAIATCVRIKTPTPLIQQQVGEELRSAVSKFEKTKSLLRVYGILGKQNTVGGIYLWVNQQAAKSFHDQLWQDNLKQITGVEPVVEHMQAPIVLPSKILAAPSPLTH